MKKLVTIVLALAMVLSLAVTAGAEGEGYPYMSKITVKGLAAGDETTINLFQIIKLDETENNWEVAEWAAEYVTLADGKYTISDDVVNAPTDKAYESRETNAITEEFNVPVGAYVVVASGAKATYTKMIANTYDAEALYMAAKDATVVAKTSGYEVTKEANDQFVARGQEVEFTVETIYPSFTKNAENKSYKLVDTSDDLAIQSVEYVKIGGEEVSGYSAGYDAENAAKYVIDLTNTIDEDNENAGKTVEVKYTAIVLTEGGYENTVNAFRNGEELDEEPPVVNGYTGDITITKLDEADGETILKGAEFNVAKQEVDEEGNLVVDEEGNAVYGEALNFVEIETGVYKLAKDGDETADTKIVATEGTVQVKGLDEGTYHFSETKAPKGYSVNEDGVTVTVEENNEAHVSVEDEILDTKLIALPETGGMGTVIFTVCGGAIMIAAAILFFANRKAEEE